MGNNARARRARLNQLMATHRLTSQHVGQLIGRNPSYVRRYSAGIQPVPENMLRLLELEIEHGRGREIVESRAAG